MKPQMITKSGAKLDLTPLSASAATGPNPQAGRPLQGPGVLHRDPQMDGTWAPTERGVTATSSKCPMFKESEGELALFQMFQTLCQPVIIPATSLPPHCLHLCIQNTDFLLPPLLRTLCPCLLSLSHALTHTHNTPHAVSQMQKRAFESASVCMLLLLLMMTMKKFTCAWACFDLRVFTFLRGCRVIVLSA